MQTQQNSNQSNGVPNLVLQLAHVANELRVDSPKASSLKKEIVRNFKELKDGRKLEVSLSAEENSSEPSEGPAGSRYDRLAAPPEIFEQMFPDQLEEYGGDLNESSLREDNIGNGLKVTRFNAQEVSEEEAELRRLNGYFKGEACFFRRAAKRCRNIIKWLYMGKREKAAEMLKDLKLFLDKRSEKDGGLCKKYLDHLNGCTA